MRIVVASIVFFLEVDDDDDGDGVEDVAVVAHRAVLCFPKQAVSDACFFPKQEVVGTVWRFPELGEGEILADVQVHDE